MHDLEIDTKVMALQQLFTPDSDLRLKSEKESIILDEGQNKNGHVN